MPRSRLIRLLALAGVVLAQVACAWFFVSDIVLSMLGIYIEPLTWESREVMELGAALGLMLGVGLGAALLWHSLSETHQMREKLRRASGAFAEVLAERFAEWGLTAAERDVAMFALKGLNTAEISALRATSEGTVKAQTAAIYRKAGVNGRGQLLSLFIDDLMEGLPAAPPAADPKTAPSGESRAR
ncbi:regulatory LuxR family protein [Rhodobacter viridis]|uniref:Regulatory LuxR family protein n=1 Tax=Rhodobacter viridis TaxID=1054202 RepID=A0A318TV84_9RHOB|nr:LuxR C-terminal-related transcriptional regulator [Rhodobacter viridis]PYF08722.1 regulatory LuxR family protein [Rhodobacter viridis]